MDCRKTVQLEWLINWLRYNHVHMPYTPCTLTGFGSFLKFSFKGVHS
jgi:hypothetical protein